MTSRCRQRDCAWYWAPSAGLHGDGCTFRIWKTQKVVSIPIIAGRMELPGWQKSTFRRQPGLLSESVEGCLQIGMAKVFHNQTDRIRPCIGCHDGASGRMFWANRILHRKPPLERKRVCHRPHDIKGDDSRRRNRGYGIRPRGDTKGPSSYIVWKTDKLGGTWGSLRSRLQRRWQKTVGWWKRMKAELEFVQYRGYCWYGKRKSGCGHNGTGSTPIHQIYQVSTLGNVTGAVALIGNSTGVP